ncbi:MAG: hypothetical protein ABI867_11070 [Kofleriaceae bacterium]
MARIGYGLKEGGGEVTSIRAMRVYVPYKRPLAELDAAERIPAEIEGLPTDVITGGVVGYHSRGTIGAGDKIIRDNPGDFSAAGSGTVGMFVTRGAQRLMLTNQHVLNASFDTVTNRDVYSPKVSCYKSFATVQNEKAADNTTLNRCSTPHPFNGKSFVVDAEVAELVAAAKVINTAGSIGAIAGGNDITGALDTALSMHLRKRGASTDVTGGVLTDVFGGTVSANVDLTITPTNLAECADFDEAFELDPTQNITTLKKAFTTLGLPGVQFALEDGDKRLRVFGKHLSAPGDSGSVWLDDSRKVVGLHHGAVGVGALVRIRDQAQLVVFGRALACAMPAVFDALGLAWPASILIGASPTAGEHQPTELQQTPWPDEAVTRELEAALATTEGGRKLLGLGRRHYPEIADLVHHRRRVTIAWHRHHGPSFSVGVLRALAEGVDAMPIERAGVPLAAALVVMRDVLSMEGSGALRRDLEAHGSWILELAAHSGSLTSLLAEIARR